MFLYADNCCGQNKNNCMLCYLAWRVMMGCHTQKTLTILVVGHTKFSPDWCFGLLKRLYRRTKLGSLQAIAQVINKSTECNCAQLVITEDGTTLVPTFYWTSYFALHFKQMMAVKNYHNFRFCSSEPGVVYTKIHCDTEEEKHILLKKTAQSWYPNSTEYPSQVPSKGLTAERQSYFFDYIRQFYPDEDNVLNQAYQSPGAKQVPLQQTMPE